MSYVDGEKLVQDWVEFNTVGKEVVSGKRTWRMKDKDTVVIEHDESWVYCDVLHTMETKRDYICA